MNHRATLWLLAAAEVFIGVVPGIAQALKGGAATAPLPSWEQGDQEPGPLPAFQTVGEREPADQDSNALGVSLLKNLLSDQKAIWTSPLHLRWADGTWLFPLTAATAGFLATDRAVPPALSPSQLNRYTKFSNFGVFSLVGAGAGLYVWSKFSRDDHQRETGFLAGEAAIDSFAVNTALKYSFRRARPSQDGGLGHFNDGGTSFPSDHSAVAWSIASVIAHEYPGPLTQVAMYGLATAVSASRVLGGQHFPSDVVVGSAIGWLIGRQVYHAHHDPNLGGAGSDSLTAKEMGEERRDRHSMGSTFVPLNSWVYRALEKLAALGYIPDALLGLKPWTRLECARLTDEAGESIVEGQRLSEEAARLQARLAQEFAYEINLLDGGRNAQASLESIYARGVSISGPALTDGYHFGQTVAYDFGRPFERGTNAQVGGSFRAESGPLAVYIQAEYQHAPAAPPLSSSVIDTIAHVDMVTPSQVPGGPIPAIDRLELLDTYAAVNINNWELVLGRQSLVWAPSADDGMLWSDNIEPVKMVRLVTPEPFRLPSFLKIAGPVRFDQFFGRLEGHPYIQRPFIYGNKISCKPFPFLELGFARTVTIGGTGQVAPGNALTAQNLIGSFFGVPRASVKGVPGKNDSEMDWTFYVPKVGNYIVLYGDAYAADDILPIENPPRNPWNAGVYLTRFPGIPKLDFHMQGVSTENSTIAHTHTNRGLVDYYGDNPDGYTQYRNLIGNTVGRDGRAIHAWLTYRISPENMIQVSYRSNRVSPDFIPQGGAWQDYGLRNETHFSSGFYVESAVQFEHISRYPVLFQGSQNNVTATLEVGFLPGRGK